MIPVASEQYPDNFIRPYREWIVGGEDWRRLRYDLSLPLGLLVGLTAPLRRFLPSWMDLDVGWHGSSVGRAAR
ncbi:MAG: hypothetical protein QUV06_08430 [Cyanobium sp. CZS 48M]|nr:hypothetical protein [Cyanobium sp. CZS48M]